MKLSHFIATVALGTAAMATPVTAFAQDEDVKVATGWELNFDHQTSVADVNFVTFPFRSPFEVTRVQQLNLAERAFIENPVRVGDSYYFYTFAYQVYGYDAIGFYRYDIEEQNLVQIADYGSKARGVAFGKLCYDYTDGTLYGCDGFMGGTALVTVDMETGVSNKICDLHLPADPEHPDFEDHLSAMAINYDGELYGLTYWGNIVKINKHTGQCRVISKMDYNPEEAFMYTTANYMFFDYGTGECYLKLYTYPNQHELRRLDLKTGHSEKISEFSPIGGIFLPFTAAEPSAPAAAKDMTVTAADNGVCEATISWTNPTKTYGRGGTLEELDKIELYRDEELIHTVDNPAIGGKETFTDTPGKPDYYNYKVVGYNYAGRGDRICVAGYVGMGIPQIPENAKAVAEDDGIRVSWTMPDKGMFDSYIDYADVTYDIIRYEGRQNMTSTTVAENISAMEYVDTPDHLGRFSYGIKAHNSIGKGGMAQTADVVGGPSARAPYNFSFNTENDQRSWTVIDGDGDYFTWTAEQSGPFSFSMTNKYHQSYGNSRTMDYLFSPQVLMEKGKRYCVKFNVRPGSNKVAEDLAVSFGDTPSPERQDSVTQFRIISKDALNLRAKLPVVNETGRYHFGFVHRTAVPNYKISINSVSFEEDHEGYALVTVKDEEGNPIKDASVTVPGIDDGVIDKDGNYRLDYLPAGTSEITVKALGYLDEVKSVDITEYETSSVEIVLKKRPVHKIYGKVSDAVGDPVENAFVSVDGYNKYTAHTGADGSFELDNVYEAEGYTVGISKNRHIPQTKNYDVAGDINLGTVTLADNTRAPRTVKATEDEATATVEWAKPSNDPCQYRYDDGTAMQYVGLQGAGSNAVFGSVYRIPSTVHSVDFFIGSAPGISHYSVYLYIFDLDENGEPTSRILYRNSYVHVQDDQWNTYTLSTPVEAPNGFFVAIGDSNGQPLLVVDGGGDREKYPFYDNVNCFARDYTTGEFHYSNLGTNFLMRAEAAPYDDADMIQQKARFIRPGKTEAAAADELTAHDYVSGDITEPERTRNAPARVLEDRLRYDVYRFNENDLDNREAWVKIGDAVKEQTLADNGWQSLGKGIYKYAVSAIYADNVISEPAVSDIIGRDMHASFNLNVFTNTTANCSEGAAFSMTSSDARFRYEALVDATGRVELPGVWKGVYTVNVTKEGYEPYQGQLEIADEPVYNLDVTLKEVKINPVGLRYVHDEDTGEDMLAWNIPALLKGSFEEKQGHPAFSINSPGYAGWSYIDGDGMETSGFGNCSWENAFQPMAWITFNPDRTEPSLLAEQVVPAPTDGEQYLVSFSSGSAAANDDYLISPRLFFDKPFSMQFDAAGWAMPEDIAVGYSTTDKNAESFVWLDSIQTKTREFSTYQYDIPAEARYTAIRYFSQGNYLCMLDNIKIGDATDILMDNYGYYNPPFILPEGKSNYEVYLNGTLLAETDQNTLKLEGLDKGHYLAAVRSVYPSGYSDMTTVEFDILTSGIGVTTGSKIAVSLFGRMLTVKGECDSVEIVSIDGLSTPLSGDGFYDLSPFRSGVYLVRVAGGDETIVKKVILK